MLAGEFWELESIHLKGAEIEKRNSSGLQDEPAQVYVQSFGYTVSHRSDFFYQTLRQPWSPHPQNLSRHPNSAEHPHRSSMPKVSLKITTFKLVTSEQLTQLSPTSPPSES